MSRAGLRSITRFTRAIAASCEWTRRNATKAAKDSEEQLKTAKCSEAQPTNFAVAGCFVLLLAALLLFVAHREANHARGSDYRNRADSRRRALGDGPAPACARRAAVRAGRRGDRPDRRAGGGERARRQPQRAESPGRADGRLHRAGGRRGAAR